MRETFVTSAGLVGGVKKLYVSIGDDDDGFLLSLPNRPVVNYSKPFTSPDRRHVNKNVRYNTAGGGGAGV